VIFGLTFLPALLGMLGPRVNRLTIRGALAAVRGRGHLDAHASDAPGTERAVQPEHSRWERVARGVMAHPIAVLLPTLLILLAVGTPFLRINQQVPDASVLPAGRESRDALVALRNEFPDSGSSPFVILADVAGDPTTEQNIAAVRAYTSEIAALKPQVTSIVSPFASDQLVDPTTGAPFTAAQLAQMFAAPASSLPPQLLQLRTFLESYISGSTVRVDAYTTVDPTTGEGIDFTRTLRTVPLSAGVSSAEVGGYIAGNYDTLTSMRERTPWAVGVTMLVSAIVLFLLFGSIVIPIKAVFMTLLSITASFGALVWIFQEGNLHDVLNFTPLGYTIAGNPIIMFAVIFGLSMDYEVLLLSRVQEAYRRTNDNTASVAEGLARTASVITGAALIMVSVFAAFALAETITIKSIGVGMAIAVLVDATVIRVLLVPSTMRLLGRWNWWAPGPLGRLADRLGFSHVEDAEELAPRPAAS
jgi:RND superfamily putative drug exporter